LERSVLVITILTLLQFTPAAMHPPALKFWEAWHRCWFDGGSKPNTGCQRRGEWGEGICTALPADGSRCRVRCERVRPTARRAESRDGWARGEPPPLAGLSLSPTIPAAAWSEGGSATPRGIVAAAVRTQPPPPVGPWPYAEAAPTSCAAAGLRPPLVLKGPPPQGAEPHPAPGRPSPAQALRAGSAASSSSTLARSDPPSPRPRPSWSTSARPARV